MVVATTGFFDGMHLGHKAVLDAAVGKAEMLGQECVAVTFWPHPRTVLQLDAVSFRLISSLEQKKRLLKERGVDRVEVLDFNRRMASLKCEDFVREYLISGLGVGTLVIGYDHRLGSDQLSGSELEDLLRRLGVEPVMVPCKGENISSTSIRKALLESDIRSANEMLGYRYGLSGVVVSGNRLGRTINFPTANLALYEPLMLIPGDGVYLVAVELMGNSYHGICNIGVRPTVKGSGRTIETHILDFDEDIYGLKISIEFICYLRGEKCFSSMEELKKQICRDEIRAREIIADLSD
ncbi:MAG: riboflavin biosynthesis protein RibF [Bacteroidales bacterium]|nr:riboflavin biosynthesis protein RibF [Bacteroidales bacterium]